MKQFSVPCKHGLVKEPIEIYIGLPAKNKHPFYYQNWFFLNVHRNKIDPEIYKKFGELYEIAKEKNISFEQLCSHVLKDAEKRAYKNKRKVVSLEDFKQAALPKNALPFFSPLPLKKLSQNSNKKRGVSARLTLLVQSYLYSEILFTALSQQEDIDSLFFFYAYLVLHLITMDGELDISAVYKNLCYEDLRYNICVTLDVAGGYFPEDVCLTLSEAVKKEDDLHHLRKNIIYKLVQLAARKDTEQHPVLKEWAKSLHKTVFYPL